MNPVSLMGRIKRPECTLTMGTQIVLFSPLHLSQLRPDGDIEDTRVSHGLGGDCHIQKIVCVCFQNV